MTIKQQGGIFGRNPTFNDLTVFGSVSVPNDSISGDAIDGGNATLEVLTVGDTGRSFTGVYIISSTSGESELRMGDTDTDAGSIAYHNNTNEMTFRTNAAPRAVLDGSGNFAPTGNVVMVSGKGIDFSATSDAAGSSSELFDDYEEGTFTPTYTTTGTDFDSVSYSVRYGNYVKIGSLIFVTGFIRTSSITLGSASGSVKIGGMPFARSGSMSPPGICHGNSWSGDVPRSCLSFTDSTLGLYYRTGGNTGDQAVQVADLNVSGNNDCYFSCMFRENY